MPAAWMIFHMDQKMLAFEPLSQLTSQRQAIWFLIWMLGFNTYEDFLSVANQDATTGVYDVDFVSCHVAHFLILVDFSLFLLRQAYDSKVAKDEPPSRGQLQD